MECWTPLVLAIQEEKKTVIVDHHPMSRVETRIYLKPPTNSVGERVPMMLLRPRLPHGFWKTCKLIHTRFLEFTLIVGKSAVNLANPDICRLNSHTGSWNVFHSEVLKDSADVLDQVVVFVLLAPFHRTFNENLGLDKSTGDGFEGGRAKNNRSAFCICLPMSRKNMIFLGPYWALGDM